MARAMILTLSVNDYRGILDWKEADESLMLVSLPTGNPLPLISTIPWRLRLTGSGGVFYRHACL
jgi:hypothetical protein